MSDQKRYGFVMAVNRCIDCKACMVACKAENGVAEGKWRNWIEDSGIRGQFPELRQTFFPGNCMHCDRPPCIEVCPTHASSKDPNTGIVSVDPKKCIGCMNCVSACPYDARFWDNEKKTTDKCSFCAHRLAAGKEPACVATCLGKSRHFGDLNDPNSQVSRLIAQNNVQRKRESQGTGPNIYYITGPVKGLDEKGGEGGKAR